MIESEPESEETDKISSFSLLDVRIQFFSDKMLPELELLLLGALDALFLLFGVFSENSLLPSIRFWPRCRSV